MNKTILHLVILLITGYLFSCDKNTNIELRYPIIYHSSIISDEKIRLFVKDKEIVDDSLVKFYSSRYEKFFTNTEQDTIDEKIQVTYFSQDSVGIYNEDKQKTEFRSVKEISDLIYWERYDTTIFPFFKSLLNEYVIVDNLVYNKVLHQYLPLYTEEVAVPISTGYDMALKLKECYYIKKNENILKMPILECLYKYKDGFVRNSKVNNSFNEEAIYCIVINDTLMIQEYFIVLDKQ